ncbi:S8 family peptidase [Bacillus cytotoxicus]
MNKKKNLPIRIFEKRQDVDERLTEGGGNDQKPKWILSGEQLREKAIVLSEELISTQDTIETRLSKYKNTPTILKTRINENILAKSHRKDITKFFSRNPQDNKVIGITGNQELLVRIDKINELIDIKIKLDKYEQNDKVISGIDSIETFDPLVNLDGIEPQKNGKYSLKIKLVDFNNFQLNSHVFKTFNNIIDDQKNINLIKSVKYSENLVVHQVVSDHLEDLNIFSDFSPIMSIEPMPMLEVIEDDFFSDDTFDIPQPEEDTDYPVIGILDSGISQIPQLSTWTLEKRHTNYPYNLINPSHGTFVAGIINFGDILEQKDYTGIKGFKLFDAAVFPDTRYETISESDLVDNIREAIQDYGKEIKIWNLSLGSNVEIKNNQFSDFGIALDNIQDENDVLIIKSASNCSNFIEGKPVSKIANGADSVRSLTIGSIAHSKSSTDLAEINHRSPFSRIGPGPANIIKPDLVHYGGNASIDNDKAIPNGVSSYNLNGKLKKAIGTSFSTPRVTAIAADLNNKLKEEFDPVLLKALLLHSSKYPIEVDLPINEKVNQLGFGIPSKADDILFNDQHEITLVLRDTLNKGEFVEILDFPFPNSLINENGFYYGQIFLTLVNTPILASGQGPEYCQSNLEVYFGTYDHKTQRNMDIRTIRNPIGRAGSQNLLTSSSYSKKKDLEKMEFSRSEKTLIQYGDKFYPNKKYAVDISELTKGNKEKFIKAPKKWYLKIEGLYREFIESQAESERLGLSQDFCMILTIRDPFRKQNVYDEVSNLLETNNFINRSIHLSQDIDIEL